MSGRYRYGKKESCWQNRTTLEKILIATSVIVFIIVIILVILVLLQIIPVSPQLRSCTTPTCLNDASQLVQRVDPTIDPCDDFYKFACGNLLKLAHGDEKLGSFFVIRDMAKHQIQEMYNQPFQDSDHRIVKVAKKLFRMCMDEAAIERDGLNTIKEMLRIMGGWPVVEGSDWDESRFWWIPASYKLRELGYFYTSFLSVTLEIDPLNENKFIFKVSLPDVEDMKFQTFAKQKWMVDVAVAFGADEGHAVIEMAEMYDFVLDMRRESNLHKNGDPPQRLTVFNFQKMYSFINWREFINNIIGPAVRISSQDYVLFPSAQSLLSWYNFLLKTPKRIQANYILWRAIEEMIPYIPELQKSNYMRNILQKTLRHPETRSEFCIRQIRERFSPSPIDILYVQKYLPVEKKQSIKEIIQNMKIELLDMLDKADWSDITEKQKAMKRIIGLTEIVGAPEDYYDTGLLDDLDFDMMLPENETFLNLLLLSNRNYQSYMYNQIYSSKNEYKLIEWNLQTASVIGDYSRQDNIINLPATIFQDIIFNELKPKYLNYGSMAAIMGHHLLYVLDEPISIFDMDRNVIDVWSNASFVERRKECFANQMKKKFNAKNFYMADLIMQESLGLKVSYAAYNRWEEEQNEEELKLVSVDYTPKQLFWISAASYFCQPSNSYSTTLRTSEERDLFSVLVSVSVLNNKDFSKDFNCPVGSTMNPGDKCEIF